MLNKKIEIKLAGVEIPLWFNNYASAELQKMYGADITTVMETLKERLSESYLLVLTDLIKAGAKGYCYAKEMTKPAYLSEIGVLIGEEDPRNLLIVWEEIWKTFKEHMGLNIPQEETVKKKVVKNTKKAQS